jgi:hypothetical protein
VTTIRSCAEIPIVAEREAQCREPWHWDDGVPYCDSCGLYRDTIMRQESRIMRCEERKERKRRRL